MKSASQREILAMASRANYRVGSSTVIVAALHVVLVALVLTRHDRTAVVAPEPHVITAELLQSAPVAVATAIQSTPAAPPIPAPPVTRVKPKQRSEPKPAPEPVPAPVPVKPGPSPQQALTQTSAAAPQSLAGPAAPTAQGSEAPPQGKPVMALNAPKNVSHLDCRIVKPDYPTRSKRLGETGTAYVRFVVGLTGQIEDVELKKSSGFDRLDAVALEAMRASSCAPPIRSPSTSL